MFGKRFYPNGLNGDLTTSSAAGTRQRPAALVALVIRRRAIPSGRQ
jgi:hypothetical protein